MKAENTLIFKKYVTSLLSEAPGEPLELEPGQWAIEDPETGDMEEIRQIQDLGIYADERNRWWRYEPSTGQRQRVQYQLGASFFTIGNDHYVKGPTEGHPVKAEYNADQDVFKAGDKHFRADKPGELSQIEYSDTYQTDVVPNKIYKLYPGRARVESVTNGVVTIKYLDEADTKPGWGGKEQKVDLKEFMKMVHSMNATLNPYKKFLSKDETGLGHGGRKAKGQQGKVDTNKWAIDLYNEQGGFLIGFIASHCTVSMNLPSASPDDPERTSQYVREYAKITGDDLTQYMKNPEHGKSSVSVSPTYGHTITVSLRKEAFENPDLVPAAQKILVRYFGKGFDDTNAFTNYILGWGLFKNGLHVGRNDDPESMKRILIHFTKRPDIAQAVKEGFNGKVPKTLR